MATMPTRDEPAAAPLLDGPPRDLLFSTTFLLKRLGMHVKDRSAEGFEGTGLNGQHYAVLLTLDEAPRVTQAAIADALGYDRSVLVGLLDDLEGKGYVERRRDPEDRRRHLVKLTEAGREVLGRLRTVSQGVERDFLAPLDDAQRAALRDLLLQLMTHHDVRCAAGLKP
jgi:DNA-binding MarR family transcriptional regulator